MRVKQIIGIVLLYILLGFSLGGCLGDTNYENLTMQEAQEKNPFDICLPDNIPQSLKISSSFNYHAEFGDPEESDIRFKYINRESNKVILEIKEKHTPGRWGSYNEAEEKYHGSQKLKLVAWLEDYRRPFDRYDKLLLEITSTVT